MRLGWTPAEIGRLTMGQLRCLQLGGGKTDRRRRAQAAALLADVKSGKYRG